VAVNELTQDLFGLGRLGSGFNFITCPPRLRVLAENAERTAAVLADLKPRSEGRVPARAPPNGTGKLSAGEAAVRCLAGFKSRADGPTTDYRSQSADSERRTVLRLRSIGVDTASVVPPRPCKPVPLHSPTDENSRCPSEPFVVVAFDHPIRSNMDEWRVPMIIVGYNPSGRVGTIYDVIVLVHNGQPEYYREVARVHFD
jgi:hypothetical protein